MQEQLLYDGIYLICNFIRCYIIFKFFALFFDREGVNRKIELASYLAYYLVTNTFDGTTSEKHGSFRTTKSKGEHGVGLSSVKAAVEKYNGALDIRYEDNLFAVTAILLL